MKSFQILRADHGIQGGDGSFHAVSESLGKLVAVAVAAVLYAGLSAARKYERPGIEGPAVLGLYSKCAAVLFRGYSPGVEYKIRARRSICKGFRHCRSLEAARVYPALFHGRLYARKLS